MSESHFPGGRYIGEVVACPDCGAMVWGESDAGLCTCDGPFAVYAFHHLEDSEGVPIDFDAGSRTEVERLNESNKHRMALLWLCAKHRRDADTFRCNFCRTDFSGVHVVCPREDCALARLLRDNPRVT